MAGIKQNKTKPTSLFKSTVVLYISFKWTQLFHKRNSTYWKHSVKTQNVKVIIGLEDNIIPTLILLYYFSNFSGKRGNSQCLPLRHSEVVFCCLQHSYVSAYAAEMPGCKRDHKYFNFSANLPLMGD